MAILLITLMTVGYMTYQARQRQAVAPDSDETAYEEPVRQPIFPEPADIDDVPPRPDRIGDDIVELEPEDVIRPRPVDERPIAPEPVDEKGTLVRALPPTNRFELVFDTAGAALVEARLLQFRVGPDDESPLTILQGSDDSDIRVASLLMSDPRSNGLPLDRAVYEIVAEEDYYIIFRREFRNGLVVTRRFDFPPDKQHINLTVTMENASSYPIVQQYEMTIAGRVLPEYLEQRYLGAKIAVRDRGKIDVQEKKFKKNDGGVILHENSPELPILWAGSMNKYFAGFLAPQPQPGDDYAQYIRATRFQTLEGFEERTRLDGTARGTLTNYVASFISREITIQAGAEISHSYLFYIGPKDKAVFEAHEEYAIFEPVIHYGFLHPISAALLWLLDFFYGLIPNYGVAIILMTFVVRLGLHGFTRKSQMSMHKMQKLQPEMKKIQEKYKHDKQRAGREQMELFRKHGVNPMGGCLPILLQMPVFLGLFWALQSAVQLRDQPFILWINDLSRPDTLAYLKLPFFGLSAINVLPVLMVGSWILQQHLMPKSPDPQARKQQQMMMMMPIMFGVMLYNMASGLTLYWLTSTTMGIIEQKFIRGSMARMQAEDALKEPEQQQKKKTSKAKR